jgi:hypothetical protein
VRKGNGKRCFVLVSSLAALAGLVAPLHAGDHSSEFVPEVNAFLKFTDSARLFLLGDMTRDATENETTEKELGLHLDLTLRPQLRSRLGEANWARDRYLWTRVGYSVLNRPDSGGRSPTERRGIVEVTARVPLGNEFWLVNRGRVDLRDIQGDHSQRYRLRLGIEREITIGGVAVVPYAQAEVFYDTRFDAWSRRLYQSGAEIEITRHWRIEPYYARQKDTRPATAYVDRVGLVLKYFH